MKRLFTASVALLGATILSSTLAQEAAPAASEPNLFGDELPQQSGGSIRGRRSSRSNAEAKEGFAQSLIFNDNRVLHGEVVEITKDEIVWSRPDAGAPLHFKREEIRRIATGSEDDQPQGFFQQPINQRGVQNASGKSSPATLKLPGGDWLFGKVTSTDGQTFAVQLNQNSRLEIPRARMEWIQFGETPTPAFDFAGSALDMEGWIPSNASMELAGTTLIVKGSSWIGRNIVQPSRFEIAFELPADTEEGTRLWLQPFGPQINCYGQGTAEIRFGKKEIQHLLYLEKFERQGAPLPKEVQEDQGPGKYRIFYDEAHKRLVVQRNGKQIGDWTYETTKEPGANAAAVREFRFNAICFDRESFGRNEKPLSFNQLRMLPWNGILPKEGETESEPHDQLNDKDGTSSSGTLESMAEKEFTFSGATHPVAAGTFIQFPPSQNPSFQDGEAKLNFGPQGEFSARHLEAHDGKLRCETSFASTLELPLSALQRLTFPARPSTSTTASDTLVFKNGDELHGKVVSAGLPGPIRWRIETGQEIDFEPSRIAGLRVADEAKNAETRKPEQSAAVMELRNGERVSGKLLALDDKQLRMESARLGSRTLDRKQLWHLFPNPQIKAFDGGPNPGGWKWSDHTESTDRRTARPVEATRWVHLDGTYYIRDGGNFPFFDVTSMPGMEHELTPDMERFEIRAEAAGLAGQYANLLIALIGKNTTRLNATISYNQMQLVVMDPQGRQPNWRDIPLQEKIGQNNTRRAIRLFVDMQAGTCDIVINGVHITRIGSEKKDRLQKGQYTVRVVPYPNQTSLLSNLWVGPWNGEIPHTETEAAATTALTNGDVAPGVPKSLHEGKLTIDSELGELNFPLEKTLAVDFGGALESRRASARLRLDDGTTLDVETFRWEGDALTAHSATFGELHLPATAVREIVYDPALARAPLAVKPRGLAQKGTENSKQ